MQKQYNSNAKITLDFRIILVYSNINTDEIEQ